MEKNQWWMWREIQRSNLSLMKIRMKPLSRKQFTLLQSSICLFQCNFESMIFPFSRWDWYFSSQEGMLEIQKTQKLGSWDLFWVMIFYRFMGFIRKNHLGSNPQVATDFPWFLQLRGLENPKTPLQKSHTGWLSRISSILIGSQKYVRFVLWGFVRLA